MIEPATDNGMEIKNQMKTMATIVPNGMAPEECTKIKKKFNKINTKNKEPGTIKGVKIMFNFQSSPPKNLYKQQAEQGENNCDGSNDKDLDTTANKNRQKHLTLWWSEDVTVNQLPSTFVGNVVVQVDFVVLHYIVLQSSQQDMGDNKAQNDDNQGEVDQGKPLDLGVVDVQVLVPSGGPSGLAFDEVDRVCKSDSCVGVFSQSHRRQVGVADVVDVVALDACSVQGVRYNGGTHNSVVAVLSFMVLDLDLKVVIQVGHGVVIDVSDVEAQAVELGLGSLFLDLVCNRQTVYYPIVAVASPDVSVDEHGVGLVVCGVQAQGHTLLGLQHFDLEWRVENSIAENNGAQALGLLLGPAVGVAEVELGVVVVVGVDIRLGVLAQVLQRRRQVVDEQRDQLALFVVGGRNSREVERIGRLHEPQDGHSSRIKVQHLQQLHKCRDSKQNLSTRSTQYFMICTPIDSHTSGRRLRAILLCREHLQAES